MEVKQPGVHCNSDVRGEGDECGDRFIPKCPLNPFTKK
jgi:hypothetical protein